MQSQPPKRSKGKVGVESKEGRLRLRLPRQLFDGQQKYISLETEDSPINRELAQHQARQIEIDILTNCFDQTLNRYKPASRLRLVNQTQLEFPDLWQQFVKFKALKLEQTTIIKRMNPIARRVIKYGKSVQTKKDATQFLLWLDTQVSGTTCHMTMQTLSACYEWGISQGIVDLNPYQGLTDAIKQEKAKKAKPYSKEEMDGIISAFQSDRYYCSYTPLVKFLFMTGCRTSEAAGLCWKHVSSSCGSIEFTESATYLSGKLLRKSTKTDEQRTFTCPASLGQLLLSIRPENFKPDDPVFPSPRNNKPINMDNWRNRAWVQMLEKAQVPYRRQYDTRSTFVNICLEQGIDAKDIAAWLGNSPEIIYEHYSVPSKKIVPPDIF
ncbi:MAG TPA: tyrosine-type recombinase/integrase [Coleofasciculaceae cyanobacterium]|jgi:integrase